MECPKISNDGTGVNILETIFYVKFYVHVQHCQLLMMKDKCDTIKYIDT